MEDEVTKGWFLAICCFLLGAFGAHRFMVGKVGTGILWIITLGWLGIGVIIDTIVILCGKFKTKSGRRIPLGV